MTGTHTVSGRGRTSLADTKERVKNITSAVKLRSPGCFFTHNAERSDQGITDSFIQKSAFVGQTANNTAKEAERFFSFQRNVKTVYL
jgi:hypothetical protein